MIRKSLRFLIFLILPLYAGASRAETPNCLSPLTKFDVCNYAKEVQAGLAEQLPFSLNANITLSTATVVGPRIVITALWKITKGELDSRLSSGGMSLAQLSENMQSGTEKSVCSMPQMAAFVRLGGQVQYIYRTADGFNALFPLVESCPRP